MVCTNNKNIYEIIRMLRSHGMVREGSDNKITLAVLCPTSKTLPTTPNVLTTDSPTTKPSTLPLSIIKDAFQLEGSRPMTLAKIDA